MSSIPILLLLALGFLGAVASHGRPASWSALSVNRDPWAISAGVLALVYAFATEAASRGFGDGIALTTISVLSSFCFAALVSTVVGRLRQRLLRRRSR